MTTQLATLAGGCFWCLEAVFEQLRGVTKVVSGYSGGQMPNPSYEAVCTGTTGHAEVVQVTFDPDELSYRDLRSIARPFSIMTTSSGAPPTRWCASSRPSTCSTSRS